MAKGYEFLDVDVEWISLVFTPERPANRIPVIVARMDGISDATAVDMIVARADGFDPDEATFNRVIPIARMDSGIKTLYGIVYRKNETDTAETWARKETVRKMMERFMRRGLVRKIETNHDNKMVPDCYVSESWIVQRNDPRFQDPKDEDAWAVGVKVENPKVWARVERGECTGFSLRGMAEMTKGKVDIPEEIAATARAGQDGDDGVLQGEVECRKWTSAYVNDLPDSSFAYIASGGEKDEDKKTTPRSLRKLPYKDKDGNVDMPHLRNALARLDQTDGIPEGERESIRKKLEGILKKEKKEMKKTAGEGAGQKSMVSRALKTVMGGLGSLGEALGVSRSEFSDALKAEKGTKRLNDLWYLLCDAYWKIIMSPDIDDKESAIVESVEDFAAAVNDGTEVSRATIRHAARIKEGTADEIEAQMAEVRKSVEAARTAAGVQGTDNKEESEMDPKEIQKMIDTTVTAAVARIGEEMDKKLEALKPKAPDGTAVAGAVAPVAGTDKKIEERIVAAEQRAEAAEKKAVELAQKIADQAGKGPDAEKVALTEQVQRSEEALKTLKDQVSKSEKELGEARERLERLEKKRPAARTDEGDQGDPRKGSPAPALKLTPKKGLPVGQVL